MSLDPHFFHTIGKDSANRALALPLPPSGLEYAVCENRALSEFARRVFG